MIETLTDDSQILLLYLADELPQPDRQLIEQRLAVEPTLRIELEQLGAIQRQLNENLDRLDALAGLPVNERAAVRAVGAEMRKRLAMPRTVAPAERAARAWRLRPWMISTGVAACVIVSAAIWIEHSGHDKSSAINVPQPATMQAEVQPDENLALFVGSFKATDSELADAVNGANARKDVVSQDDVSQYLLNVGSAQN